MPMFIKTEKEMTWFYILNCCDIINKIMQYNKKAAGNSLKQL